MALQQGGLGLILTVLIVTAPPMAASFFQDMLGAFTLYTAFSSDGGAEASRNGRWGGGNSYPPGHGGNPGGRSEEHTSELKSLMRNSEAVFRLKKKTTKSTEQTPSIS